MWKQQTQLLFHAGEDNLKHNFSEFIYASHKSTGGPVFLEKIEKKETGGDVNSKA